MTKCYCPKCEADISDSYQGDDPSVGIYGGFYCDACDIPVEAGYEPSDDDVSLTFMHPLEPIVGTPISELSGQPGDPRDPNDPRHAKYERFNKIAKSWGYD